MRNDEGPRKAREAQIDRIVAAQQALDDANASSTATKADLHQLFAVMRNAQANASEEEIFEARRRLNRP